MADCQSRIGDWAIVDAGPRMVVSNRKSAIGNTQY
jgi:hypothetical protein